MKVFYLVLFCFSLFSCRKTYQKANPVVNEDPDNLTQQLTGAWKLYAQTSNPENDWDGDGTSETNMFGTYTSCEKDAGLRFYADGKGTIKNSCVDSTSVHWKITNSSNDFQYTLLDNGGIKSSKIIQLNKNYFIISGSRQANGKNFLIVSRYFRQQ